MATIVVNTLLSTYTCTSSLCATVADRILCHVHPYIQSAVSMNPLLRTRLIQCMHFVDMIQLFSTYSSQSCCQFPSHESHNADSPSPSNQPSLVSMRVCVCTAYTSHSYCLRVAVISFRTSATIRGQCLFKEILYASVHKVILHV